jgi:DMSO reductase family type II enzyme heme b subunit
MKRRDMTYGKQFRLILATVAIATIAGASLAIAQGAAPADGTIKVGQIQEGTLTDPTEAAWNSVPQAGIDVATAFPGHPSIVGEATATGLLVQAAKLGNELYIRLQWKDSSLDGERGIGKFADGVAVQFAADGSDETQPFMGGDGRRVNIWYWNASKKAAENLVADGFGALTPAAIQDVKASGDHADGTWTVVFHRTLKAQGDDNVPLETKGGTNLPIAFAVWNGANSERDGFKAVTLEWQQLLF